MVLVGGATRLTESGLSIVEWKPVTGALPPLDARAMERGVRGLQDDSAISRTQRRHDACRVQDDLLVGMEPSAARAGDRHRLSAAVSVVPVARRARAGAEAARCGASSGSARCRARSAGGWWRRGCRSGSRCRRYRLATHLVLALLIFAAIVWTLRRLARAAADRGAGAAGIHRAGAAGADLRAALFRRAGRGAARRARCTTPGRRSTAR